MKTHRFFPGFSAAQCVSRPRRRCSAQSGRRLLTCFLLVLMLFTLSATPLALAEETDGVTVADGVEDPKILGKSALLVDQKTGTVLYAKNEHKELYPASLTKIMTCLLVLEAVDAGQLSMDQEITAPEAAFVDLDKDGSTANIQAGETMTVKNLLYCMMVVSANESCNIMAVTLSGSISAFVDKMNERATALGCKNTHFANPIGLQDTEHYTSAWDLYLITKEALTHPEFMEICDTADVVIPATNMSDQRHLYSTNYLLSRYRATGYLNSEAHGIKTGSTSDAGHCLVSSATRGSLNFLSVIMGADVVKQANGKNQVQSFSETTRMFNWGFENFTYQTVLTTTDMIASVPVTLSSEVNYVTAHPAEDVSILMPKDIAPEDLQRMIRTSKSVEAPVSQGDKLGEVRLVYGETTFATVPLVALNDVSSSPLLVTLNHIQQFFEKPLIRVIGVLLIALIVGIVVWKLTVGRRRYRSGKSVRPTGGYRGKKRKP